MYRCCGWGSLQTSADQQQVQLPAWPKRPNHMGVPGGMAQ
jgi:hypothetical protein